MAHILGLDLLGECCATGRIDQVDLLVSSAFTLMRCVRRLTSSRKWRRESDDARKYASMSRAVLANRCRSCREPRKGFCVEVIYAVQVVLWDEGEGGGLRGVHG